MPQEEDPMPLDGNPHPLPGQLQQDNLKFVLPQYPAIGWNDLPAPLQVQPEQPADDAPTGELWLEMGSHGRWLLQPLFLRFMWSLNLKSSTPWCLTTRINLIQLTK